jgi:hypothetical protein
LDGSRNVLRTGPRLPFTGNTPPWTLVGHAHAAVRLVAAIRLVAARAGDYLPSAENNDACAVTPGAVSRGARGSCAGDGYRRLGRTEFPTRER